MNNLLSFQVLNKKFFLFARFAFWAGLAFFFVKFACYHFRLITFPFPLEYREGAMMVTTQLLIQGKNPFALELQPAAANVYGIFYHFIVFPFAKLFGPTMFIHRLISAVFIFGCCGVLCAQLRFYKVHRIIASAAVIIFYASLLAPVTSTPIAGPHSLGFFIFLCSLFVPQYYKYSWRSLWFSLFCIICAFYTKPYFVLALPYLSMFLFLWVSKKKGVLFGLAGGGILIATMILTDNIFPAYFNNVYFSNLNITSSVFGHMVSQFKVYAQDHNGILFAVGLMFIYQVICFLQARFHKQPLQLHVGFPSISLVSWDKPLISKMIDPSAFYLSCSLILVYFLFGRHMGSWMAYLVHLISPFFLLWACSLMQRFEKGTVLFAVLLGINVYTASLSHVINLDIQRANWDMIQRLITSHTNILNSPAIAPLLVEQNKPVYDSGQSEFFKIGAYRNDPLSKLISPPDARVMLRHYEYLRELSENIQRKEFDLVIITRNYAAFTPYNLTEYYEPVGSIQVLMPHFRQNWMLVVFRPK